MRALHHKQAETALAHAIAAAKMRHDQKRKPLEINVGDRVSLKLHRGYMKAMWKTRTAILSNIGTDRKVYTAQRKAKEEMGCLKNKEEVPIFRIEDYWAEEK